MEDSESMQNNNKADGAEPHRSSSVKAQLPFRPKSHVGSNTKSRGTVAQQVLATKTEPAANRIFKSSRHKASLLTPSGKSITRGTQGAAKTSKIRDHVRAGGRVTRSAMLTLPQLSPSTPYLSCKPAHLHLPSLAV